MSKWFLIRLKFIIYIIFWVLYWFDVSEMRWLLFCIWAFFCLSTLQKVIFVYIYVLYCINYYLFIYLNDQKLIIYFEKIKEQP